MANSRLEHIRGALASAENSIKLAKQLLAEMESGRPERSNQPHPAQAPERPGVVGVYDGEKMTTTSGETFTIPGNYASKSLLVVGDTLKMYEENGEKRFKQVEHVKRHKTNGLLVKKDGKFRAITPEGSYKVLAESINHFSGEVGDEVVLHLPAGNLTTPYAAIETIHKKTKTEKTEPVAEKPVEDLPPVVAQKKPLETAKPRKETPKPPKPAEKKPVVVKASEPVVEKKLEEVKAAEPAAEMTGPVSTPSGEEELS